MSVHKYLLADGKTIRWMWSAYWYDWTGKRHHPKRRGYTTKKAAQKAEDEFLAMHNGTSDITLPQLAARYMTATSRISKEGTIRTRKNIIEKHLNPLFNDVLIHDITPAMITGWQTEMYKKGLSDSYLKTIQSLFSTIFNFAVKEGHLKESPLAHAAPLGSYKPTFTTEIWEPDQFNHFIDVLRVNGYKGRKRGHDIYVTLFTLLFWTGCRLGEAMALTPRDFDFANRTMYIKKTLSRGLSGYGIGTTKTISSTRPVALPQFLADIIAKWIERSMVQGNDHIFEGTSETSVERMFKKYAAKAGLPVIRVHDLRHSHASYLLSQGVNEMVVARRLGHRNPIITQSTYRHLFPREQKELANQLDQWHNGAK